MAHGENKASAQRPRDMVEGKVSMNVATVQMPAGGFTFGCRLFAVM